MEINKKMPRPELRKIAGWAGLSLLLMILIIVPFLMFGDDFEAAAVRIMSDASKGAIAVFSIMLLAGDVLLPVPSSIVSLATGAALGLWVGAVVIWFGMTLGCGVGWIIGRKLLLPATSAFGATPAETSSYYWELVLCRPIPVLAEMSILMAAARGAGFGPALTLCATANLPIAILYAHFGSYFLGDVPFSYLIAAVAVILFSFWIKRQYFRANANT